MISKERYQIFREHCKLKSPSELGKMYDDLEELREMRIREIVQEELKKFGLVER